jgi:hypothetical protein
MWILRVSPTTLKVFCGYYYGKEAGFEYVRGIRKIFKTINQL